MGLQTQIWDLQRGTVVAKSLQTHHWMSFEKELLFIYQCIWSLRIFWHFAWNFWGVSWFSVITVSTVRCGSTVSLHGTAASSCTWTLRNNCIFSKLEQLDQIRSKIQRWKMSWPKSSPGGCCIFFPTFDPLHSDHRGAKNQFHKVLKVPFDLLPSLHSLIIEVTCQFLWTLHYVDHCVLDKPRVHTVLKKLSG